MPTTILQLLAWLADHWFGTILFAIVAGILIWRWQVAGKDSGEGPVAYAKKKHQFFFFIIGMVTLVLVTLFIVFAGPWFGKFFTWAVSTGVTNTEAVIMGTAVPTSNASPAATAQTQNFALPSPTAGAQTNTNPAANIYVVSDSTGATTRDPGTNATCDDDDAKLGSIPFGTEITVVGTWPSSNIPGSRMLTNTGVCVHSAALTQK